MKMTPELPLSPPGGAPNGGGSATRRRYHGSPTLLEARGAWHSGAARKTPPGERRVGVAPCARRRRRDPGRWSPEPPPVGGGSPPRLKGCQVRAAVAVPTPRTRSRTATSNAASLSNYPPKNSLNRIATTDAEPPAPPLPINSTRSSVSDRLRPPTWRRRSRGCSWRAEEES